MKVNCAHDELVELHKLIPNPKNPNKHPEKQIDRLAKIIDYQGMRSPIVVSKKSGFITRGHGKLEALKQLGWEKAPVNFQDYDSEAQEYADIVADNAIAEWAELDLSGVNTEVLELGPDSDVDLRGFKSCVIDLNEFDEESDKIEIEKTYKLEIEFPNEVEMTNVLNQMMEKGYLTKVFNGWGKNKI